MVVDYWEMDSTGGTQRSWSGSMPAIADAYRAAPVIPSLIASVYASSAVAMTGSPSDARLSSTR